jgi:hypothetical protein
MRLYINSGYFLDIQKTEKNYNCTVKKELFYLGESKIIDVKCHSRSLETKKNCSSLEEVFLFHRIWLCNIELGGIETYSAINHESFERFPCDDEHPNANLT